MKKDDQIVRQALRVADASIGGSIALAVTSRDNLRCDMREDGVVFCPGCAEVPAP